MTLVVVATAMESGRSSRKKYRGTMGAAVRIAGGG